MAAFPTLFRFRIELSDLDRGHYESLDFRVAMHPSEAPPYLLTRVIAFALNAREGLEFGPGLCVPEAPALQLPGTRGKTALWIEVGNPSARKLHKAAKSADAVKIYTYKNPRDLFRELEKETVHRLSEIELYSLPEALIDQLAGVLAKDNSWSLLHQEGQLFFGVDDSASGEQAIQGAIERHTLG